MEIQKPERYTDSSTIRLERNIFTSEKLRGHELKQAVRNLWDTIQIFSAHATDASWKPLFGTFATHLDKLDETVWETPRDIGEIRTFYTSAGMAFQYAHLKTNDRLVQPEQLSTQEACRAAFDEVFDDPPKRKLLYENLWRPPISFQPDRGISLQYILRHHFKESAITGVDLGTGPGVILPLLNSSRYTDSRFSGRDELVQLLDNQVDVGIVHGIGVDKNEREENLLWAKANAWYKPDEFDSVMEEVQLTAHKFPFVTTDLTDPDAVTAVRKALQSTRSRQQLTADFVFSSFVRYQLGHDAQTQQRFVGLVNDLLPEGGIWIDIGEEFMKDESEFQGDYAVNVYQKTNRGITKVGVPFIIAENGNILQTNLDYFRPRVASANWS